MTSWRRSAPRWSAATRIFSATRRRSPGWEALKAAERADHADESALAGVALALPALKRAEKIQRRAARVGFDWPDADGPRAKIDEELDEIERADDDEERAAELGDLLFAWSIMRGISTSIRKRRLREATARFEAALPQCGRIGRQAVERYEYR